MSLFKPKYYKKSVFDFDYDLLKKKNIRVIIFDLDNTIAKINEDMPNKKIQTLFNNLSKKFEALIVASNSSKKRVETFCKDLPCYSFHSMMKPTKKLEKVILKGLDVKKEEICIIGDQLLTDILLGNRLGITTILVDPLGEKDLKITSFNRFFEKKIMNKLNIKRGSYYEE